MSSCSIVKQPDAGLLHEPIHIVFTKQKTSLTLSLVPLKSMAISAWFMRVLLYTYIYDYEICTEAGLSSYPHVQPPTPPLKKGWRE